MTKTVTVSLKDDKNRTSKFSISFLDSASNTDIQSWLTDFLLATEPLIKGAFVSATITQSLVVDPALRRIPQQDSDVEERLIAGFRTLGNYRTSLTVATFNDAYTVPIIATKERSPDFLDPLIEAWFNMVTMASALGYVQPVDKRGNTVERVDKSRYKHRR